MINIRLWNKTFLDKCGLCGNRESTHHCLSNCKVFLNQKQYTWRHDSLIKYIVDFLDISKVSVFSDIPGFQTTNGGSLPADMAVTTLKPDVVLLDHKEKIIHLFGLTVNWESNYEKNNTYKSNTYAYFLMDITKNKPSLTAFEVGLRGNLDKKNQNRLKSLHLFMKNNIKLETWLSTHHTSSSLAERNLRGTRLVSGATLLSTSIHKRRTLQ